MRIATPNGVIYVNCVSNFGKESVFTRGCGLGDHPSRLSNSHQESKAHRDAQILKTSGREVNVLKLLQSRKLLEKKTESRGTYETYYVCQFYDWKTVGPLGKLCRICAVCS